MYYYRARYYSPQLGRFLQADPIGYEDGVNLYQYVKNDPLNNIDPTGRNTVAGAAIGCAVSGPACPAGAAVGAAIGTGVLIIGGIILYNESNKGGENSSGENTSKQPSGLKDAEKIISGGRAPGRTTSTGNKIYESPPTGQTAEEVMGGIRGLEGASSEVKEGERGPVEVVTLPDGSKVVDRNSKSGPRTIETQRTTKNGKSKISSETRFPDDPLKR